MSTSRGNSILEYVLPIALSMAVIATVLSLSDWSTLLGGSISGTNHGQIQDREMKIESHGHLDPSQMTRAERQNYYYQNGFTYQDGGTVCFTGTYCLVIPSIPGGAIAEVDGTLGGQTTNRLADFLLTLAAQLQKAHADPSVVSYVRSLANKGHEMAGTQLYLFEVASTKSETYKNSWKDIGNDPNAVHICMADRPGDCPSLLAKTNAAMNTLQQNQSEFTQLRYSLNEFIANHPNAFGEFGDASEVINAAADRINEIQNGFHLEQSMWQQTAFNLVVNRSRITTLNANTICATGQGGKPCMRL